MKGRGQLNQSLQYLRCKFADRKNLQIRNGTHLCSFSCVELVRFACEACFAATSLLRNPREAGDIKPRGLATSVLLQDEAV